MTNSVIQKLEEITSLEKLINGNKVLNQQTNKKLNGLKKDFLKFGENGEISNREDLKAKSLEEIGKKYEKAKKSLYIYKELVENEMISNKEEEGASINGFLSRSLEEGQIDGKLLELLKEKAQIDAELDINLQVRKIDDITYYRNYTGIIYDTLTIHYEDELLRYKSLCNQLKILKYVSDSSNNKEEYHQLEQEIRDSFQAIEENEGKYNELTNIREEKRNLLLNEVLQEQYEQNEITREYFESWKEEDKPSWLLEDYIYKILKEKDDDKSKERLRKLKKYQKQGMELHWIDPHTVLEDYSSKIREKIATLEQIELSTNKEEVEPLVNQEKEIKSSTPDVTDEIKDDIQKFTELAGMEEEEKNKMCDNVEKIISNPTEQKAGINNLFTSLQSIVEKKEEGETKLSLQKILDNIKKLFNQLFTQKNEVVEKIRSSVANKSTKPANRVSPTSAGLSRYNSREGTEKRGGITSP